MQTIEPSIFLQTRYTTCGVACLMMALNALGKDMPLTKGSEGELFRSMRVKGYDLVPAISLATYARRQGLTVAATIEDGPRDFWTFWRNTDPHMYEAQENAYARARAAGVTIDHNPVDAEVLKRSLSEGNLLIVGIDMGDGIKHALLVYGWEDGKFILVDPLSGRRQVPEERLVADMQMEFGKWFIAIH